MAWNSINDLLSAMEKVNYVVLRNKNSIVEEFQEGEDWDILCVDIDEVVRVSQAIPLIQGEKCFNFYTKVGDRKLLLDIRCIGDGYYDQFWEEEMLKRKKRFDNYYFLDKENYKYSILYHCLVHKNEKNAQKYFKELQELFNESDFSNYIRILSNYMKDKNYLPVIPKDCGVYINRINFQKIEEKING